MKCPILRLMVSQTQQHENTQIPPGCQGQALSKAPAGRTSRCSLEANLAITPKHLNNTRPFYLAIFLSADSKEIIRDMATKMFDIAFLSLVKA